MRDKKYAPLWLRKEMKFRQGDPELVFDPADPENQWTAELATRAENDWPSNDVDARQKYIDQFTNPDYNCPFAWLLGLN